MVGVLRLNPPAPGPLSHEGRGGARNQSSLALRANPGSPLPSWERVGVREPLHSLGYAFGGGATTPRGRRTSGRTRRGGRAPLSPSRTSQPGGEGQGEGR